MKETKLLSESAEANILYCIFKDENLLLDFMESISVDYFAFEPCKNIAEALFSLFESGKPVLIEHIYNLVSPTDVAYMDALFKRKDIYVEYYKEYLEILNNKYLIRQSVAVADSISKTVRTQTTLNGLDIIDSAFTKFDAILNKTVSTTKMIGDDIFNIIPDPETYVEGEVEHVFGLSTGFTKLDEYLCGIPGGSFVTIAGRPSLGKTMFLRKIFIYNAYTLNIPMLLFSIDEPEELIRLKTISTITGIDVNRLKKQTLSKQEINTLSKYIPEIKRMPFFIDTSPDLRITTIRSKIKKLLYKYPNLGGIGIDYVQQMGTTTEELTQVSLGIKHLCAEFKIPFFIISQLSRNIEERKKQDETMGWGSQPLLSDLRQTGCLSGETELQLAMGETKTIKELAERKVQEPLDIFALNNNYKFVPAKLEKVFFSGVKKVYEIKTRSGISIKASSNHPFLKIDGWVNLENLAVDDYIATTLEYNVYWNKIESITYIGEEKVYDATVPVYHNFIANNFIVHNSLEQDSDKVLFVVSEMPKEDVKTRNTRVWVSKQRDGISNVYVDMVSQGNIQNMEENSKYRQDSSVFEDRDSSKENSSYIPF